ncbi:hypothetical protein NP233_g3199 [Leucocoprinus birnbaumii]|uniref:Btz domain-containing protein n=1 Tax=Leucocoprinus birnbaumii TaxID=56174 RepID=A0AAD5VYE1_9AGAR|nr:hypothetical protein NP233_g3199 [Leucocoprinus birnbaumii]
MPAPVSSSSPPRGASPTKPQKARTIRPKKSRAVRRRGRARAGIESDDEIERAPSSDSETDSDESLSPDSASDSEQDSASEDDLPDRQVDAHTPNTSHSSGALEKEGAVNDDSSGAFFATSGNWSEMVAEENANGAADLPVIEFSDFKADVPPTSQGSRKKVKRAGKKKVAVTDTSLPPQVLPTSPPDPESVNGDDIEEAAPEAAPNNEFPRRPVSHPKRPVGQSARQAYQQRLESDPSFVPKVGGFWGHDDRLMDKDLRSLSGWWRGRWQGRGRGRGGFAPGIGRRGSHVDEEKNEEGSGLPPIERPWTHDGFEELKRKEEQRLENQVQRQANSSLRGVARGRGGTPATRGGRGGPPRGGFVNLGTRPSAAAKTGRVWYAMKPEHMWTKQSENFLFFEPKHRGLGSAYRVQLPGSQTQVIRPPPSRHSPGTANHVAAATASVVGSEVGDRGVVVKLPKREEEELPTTVDETPLDDVFKVRPRIVNPEPIPLPAPSNTKSSPPADRPNHQPQSSVSAAVPNPTVKSQLEQLTQDVPSVDPSRLAQTEKAVLRNPAPEAPIDEVIKRFPSPPPAQPSPAYPSSYAYPTLPPGVALNQHGVPYEMATGRPVYIPTTAPPSIYNPRPTHLPQHSLSYMSPHIHPSSAISQDFSAQQHPHSHTPSIGGFIDPATGIPMFSLPRSSRVEIRAPDGTAAKGGLNGSAKPLSVNSPNGHGSSHLRVLSSAYSHSPSHPSNEYGYNSYSSSSDVSTLPSYPSLPDGGAPLEASASSNQPMVHYPAYQQYYYPDPTYGYPQYVDVSQTGQYEMYPPMDANGTTYY